VVLARRRGQLGVTGCVMVGGQHNWQHGWDGLVWWSVEFWAWKGGQVGEKKDSGINNQDSNQRKAFGQSQAQGALRCIGWSGWLGQGVGIMGVGELLHGSASHSCRKQSCGMVSSARWHAGWMGQPGLGTGRARTHSVVPSNLDLGI